MSEQRRDRKRLDRKRVGMTALIAAWVWALLAWEHQHGGVVTHHLFARDDMPGLSNWWGGLLLPVLAWILLGRIRQRRIRDHDGTRVASDRPVKVVAGFIGAAVFGLLLSVCFSTGQEQITSYLATALLPLALLLPIYRAEYVLGFVVAMTFTFGAILPTIFACLVALMAVLMYRYVRPTLMAIFGWIRRLGAKPALPVGNRRSNDPA